LGRTLLYVEVKNKFKREFLGVRKRRGPGSLINSKVPRIVRGYTQVDLGGSAWRAQRPELLHIHLQSGEFRAEVPRVYRDSNSSVYFL
jgi:hypothetical protein